jgi:hypothetical protein
MAKGRRWLAAFALSTALATVGGSGVLAQDSGEVKPEDLFASAKAAYGEKKYGKTLSELSLLVSAISKLRIEQIKTVLPPAPDGWKAEDPSGDNTGAMTGFAGLAVHRNYTKSGAGSDEQPSVHLELVSDSPMIGMVAPMFSNPALITAQEGMSMINLKGNKRAILEWQKEQKSGSLKVLLGANNCLLTISGSNIAKTDLSDVFAKILDIEKIDKVLGE